MNLDKFKEFVFNQRRNENDRQNKADYSTGKRIIGANKKDESLHGKHESRTNIENE